MKKTVMLPPKTTLGAKNPLQAKSSQPFRLKELPAVPPMYQPFSMPAVLQPKLSSAQNTQWPVKPAPISPPIFSPQRGSKIIQPKISGAGNHPNRQILQHSNTTPPKLAFNIGRAIAPQATKLEVAKLIQSKTDPILRNGTRMLVIQRSGMGQDMSNLSESPAAAVPETVFQLLAGILKDSATYIKVLSAKGAEIQGLLADGITLLSFKKTATEIQAAAEVLQTEANGLTTDKQKDYISRLQNLRLKYEKFKKHVDDHIGLARITSWDNEVTVESAAALAQQRRAQDVTRNQQLRQQAQEQHLQEIKVDANAYLTEMNKKYDQYLADPLNVNRGAYYRNASGAPPAKPVTISTDAMNIVKAKAPQDGFTFHDSHTTGVSFHKDAGSNLPFIFHI